jgi:protease IV
MRPRGRRETTVAMRRGFGVVLVILILAALISVAGAGLIYFAMSREPGVANNSTLVLRLDGDLPETLPDDVLGQFLEGRRPLTLRHVVDNLRKAKGDSRVGAVLVLPSGLAAPHWAKLQEVRDAIRDFRQSGKPALAYLEYGSDREYYLASACSRVMLMPTAPLDLNGLASYEIFLRGTLDKAGAYPDFLHIGPYKTAANQFTERTFTPQHREMSESLNRDLYEQLIRGIADGRRKSEEEVRALVDRGPFLPENALRAGLVDDLAYFDQIDDKVKLPGGRLQRLDADDYQDAAPASIGFPRGPRIAVINAVGVITSGDSGYDPLSGSVMGAETIIGYIREARADDRVKAIVLRVDSPGGSAVASDAIWRELSLTRDMKPDRPLVVSMSDLAASGGYYIAMAAPYIVAQPGTLTGSIGIVSGKMVTGGTWAKLGANLEAVSQGRFAELNSPIRPYTPEERAKVEEYMQAFYDQFVEKAARSRHTTPDRIDAVAQGRVWTGRQAKKVGLVDDLGGLDRAIAVAKQRAKIAADTDVQVVVYPPKRSVYELLTSRMRTQEAASAAGVWSSVAPLVTPDERRALGWLSAPLRLFRHGEPLALMPVSISR